MDQPKKIATIDINISPIDWRAAFIDDHHNCPLCGSELMLTNVTHFVDQKVHEEGFCEACNIRTRHADHLLQ